MNPKYFATEITHITHKNRTKETKMHEIKQIKRYDEEELEICKKILKIPTYFLFFSPIRKFNFLNISEKYPEIVDGDIAN